MTAISGPIPAGSPMVTAIRGSIRGPPSEPDIDGGGLLHLLEDVGVRLLAAAVRQLLRERILERRELREGPAPPRLHGDQVRPAFREEGRRGFARAKLPDPLLDLRQQVAR